MHLRYEGAKFEVSLQSSIERHLIKKAIQRKIGKWIGRPYQSDGYLKFVAHLLSKGQSSVVVDVGSNIGTTILPLALQFPSAHFYAIEPHPLPAAKLIRNCELNKARNITLVSTAIGSHVEMAKIYTCPTNSGGHRLTGFSGRKDVDPAACFGPIAVPVQPLAKIFEEFSIQECQLLKVDTEGYEFFVLESLGSRLNPSSIRYIVAEYGPEGLRQTGKTGWDIVSLLLAKGYQCEMFGSGQKIRCESDIPQLPDYTVADFLFY